MTERISADVCVIGSGPAGLAVLEAFIGKKEKVVMLESGTFARPPAPDHLYEFEETGLFVNQGSRVRAFGGTSTVWSGRWKEHDEIDFIHRSWIPFSGWPISKKTLEPYYARAAALCHIPLSVSMGTYPGLQFNAPFENSLFVFLAEKYRNFGHTWRTKVTNAPNIHVYTGAHVTRLEHTNGTATAAHVVLASGEGSFVVQAKFFIIATGGIETPRLLLISDIGNEHDQVGRYYMDHPKAQTGMIEFFKPTAVEQYRRHTEQGVLSGFGLRLQDSIQHEKEILNSHVFLEPLNEQSFVSKVVRRVRPERATLVALRNHLEQAPNPQSRVTLSETRDACGYPRARVAWELDDLTRRSAQVFHQCMSDWIQKHDLGEFISPLLTTEGGPFPISNYAAHHMGTARMGADPRTSVVDADCKIHSVKNVFVAGSAVFPTAGHANPTATIMALALRLGEYVRTLI